MSARAAALPALALALLLGLAAGPSWTGEPSALRAGPMLGWGEMRETVVWLQTTRPAEVQLRFFPEGQPEAARLTPPLGTRAEEDFVAVFTLSGLEPGTRYGYEVYLDGRREPRPYPLAFATQPQWRWRSAPPDFTAMFGSCLYVNDPPYDRPGTPYGSSFEILGPMAALKPELMLWLGDNVYTREPEFGAPGGLRYRWAHTRAFPELQPLLAATHHYATWDDHDMGPNDSDGSYALKEVSLQLHQRYWPAPAYGTRTTPGTFQKLQWGDVDFFLLDDRYHRKPNRWPDGPDKTMLGREQMAWLQEGLVASRATFKVIGLGNQALNPLTKDEGLVKFPADYAALLDFIRDQRVEGVLFISGDRHISELIRLQRPGQYPLYDYTSSPITAGTWVPAAGTPEADNPHRVPGTLLTEHNFGALRFEGPEKDRRVLLRAYDKRGALKWERAIARRELTFP
jgi:alkaline phosphatase D